MVVYPGHSKGIAQGKIVPRKVTFPEKSLDPFHFKEVEANVHNINITFPPTAKQMEQYREIGTSEDPFEGEILEPPYEADEKCPCGFPYLKCLDLRHKHNENVKIN